MSILIWNSFREPRFSQDPRLPRHPSKADANMANSVALRSLAIAAECLVIRREQEEVLEIFEKIRKETGWKVGFLNKELRGASPVPSHLIHY